MCLLLIRVLTATSFRNLRLFTVLTCRVKLTVRSGVYFDPDLLLDLPILSSILIATLCTAVWCVTPLVSLTELIDLTAPIIGSIPLTPPVRNRLTRRNGTRPVVPVDVLAELELLMLPVVLDVVVLPKVLVLLTMFNDTLCLESKCANFGVPIAILRG